MSKLRIGVALAEAGSPPRPLFTYARAGRERDMAEVLGWLVRYHAAAVVIGVARRNDGKASENGEANTRFAVRLARRGAIRVHIQDEAMTTVEASEVARGDERDAVAAALILARFLARPSPAVSDIP